jgi:hypothetical protein
MITSYKAVVRLSVVVKKKEAKMGVNSVWG